MSDIDTVQLADGTRVGIVRLSAPGAIAVENPEHDQSTLADGFPSAADRPESEEEAEIRVEPAAHVTDPRPTPPLHGPQP